MTRGSLLRTITNSSNVWPPAPDSGWGHAGSKAGNFATLDRFNEPLSHRYGAFASLDVYLELAQSQNYEVRRRRLATLCFLRVQHAVLRALPLTLPSSGLPCHVRRLFTQQA